MTEQPLAMLVGRNHNQTTGFDYCTFAELLERVKAPAQLRGASVDAVKESAPICAPHNAPVKTKDEVLRHDRFTMLWADLDEGSQDLTAIQARLAALGIESYTVYATANSKPVDKRWRVLVELEEAVTFEKWHTLQSYLTYSLAGDTVALRPQQILYLPFECEQTQHFETAIGEGYPLDTMLSDFETKAHGHQQEQEAKAAQEAAKAPAKPKSRVSLAQGQQSPIELFNAAYDAASLLDSFGYKRVGKKYIHPNSSSGKAGVTLLDDGRSYYSHHSSDQLNDGHKHDAFDLFVHWTHRGDFDAAVRQAADDLDPQGQRDRRTEHKQQQTQQAAYDAFDTSTANDAPAQKPANSSPYKPFDDTPPYNLFGTFALPALPMDLIPPAIADYSADQGELIGADPAAMVLFCLGVAGACIDDRLKIQVKRHDPTWTESARLWCGVIGDPSVKKSPLLGKALAPAFAIDSEWRQETNKAMAEWRKACENTPKDEDEPPMPIGKRLLLNDATVEKVGDILSKCEPRGMLSYQDELSGWLASMDAYKGGAGGKDKGAWLEAFNGGAKFFDRISRGELYIENWSVSVLGGIQPSVIQSYAQTTNHDGMLQRFILLYAQQPKELGQDRHPQPFAKLNYSELIKHLAMLEPSANPVKLSEQAHKHREALERKVHALVCNHPNPHLTAALGKWSGLYARLLLVWHCCDSHSKQKYPTGYEVTGETAEKVAVFMWRVLLPHLLKFYGAIDPFEDSSQDLARLILAKGWQRFTVKRDFNQQWKASRKMKPWEIEQVLERLEGFNWITPDPLALRNANGTPTAYTVNPEVHALHAEQAQAERDRRQEIAAALAELQASHA